MAAWRYEISLRVLKNINTKARFLYVTVATVIFFTCEDIMFSRESSLSIHWCLYKKKDSLLLAHDHFCFPSNLKIGDYRSSCRVPQKYALKCVLHVQHD